MSILAEYEQLRNEIGEDKFHQLEVYLSFHPDKLLSDVYYKKSEWDAAMTWINENQELLNYNPDKGKDVPESVKYDEYLNHKSILECQSVKDIEQHANDMDKMFGFLETSGATAALVTATYMDPAHKGQSQLSFVLADEFRKELEAYNQKNGVDVVIHEDKIGAVIYGATYTHGSDNVPGMEEVLLTYQLFDDEKMDFTNLVERLDRVSSEEDIQKVLSDVSKEDVFFADGNLKSKLRDVKRLPLDVQIKNGEKILKEQQEEKQKRKQKGKNKDKGNSYERE